MAPYWFSSDESANAQYNDLEFRRELEIFKEIDSTLAEAIIETFNLHLDFENAEMCFLSLAASKVTNDEKRAIGTKNNFVLGGQKKI